MRAGARELIRASCVPRQKIKENSTERRFRAIAHHHSHTGNSNSET